MKLGKLYEVQEYSWLCVSTKELVISLQSVVYGTGPHRGLGSVLGDGGATSAWWAQHAGFPVSCVAKNSLVVLLEQDDILVKLLTSDGTVCWTAVTRDSWWCFVEPHATTKGI